MRDRWRGKSYDIVSNVVSSIPAAINGAAFGDTGYAILFADRPVTISGILVAGLIGSAGMIALDRIMGLHQPTLNRIRRRQNQQNLTH